MHQGRKMYHSWRVRSLEASLRSAPKIALAKNDTFCVRGSIYYFFAPQNSKCILWPRFTSSISRTLYGPQKFILRPEDKKIIFGETMIEANERFNTVAQNLREANLTLELEKSEFLKRAVCYFGHIISEYGIKSDPKKVEAVGKLTTPKHIKNIREFLELSGYYRRFIKNYTMVTKPLNILLEKDVKLYWGKEKQEAFEEINFLCTAPVLEYPRFDEPFIITTDASNFALGAVLSQGKIGKET